MTKLVLDESLICKMRVAYSNAQGHITCTEQQKIKFSLATWLVPVVWKISLRQVNNVCTLSFKTKFLFSQMLDYNQNKCPIQSFNLLPSESTTQTPGQSIETVLQ